MLNWILEKKTVPEKSSKVALPVAVTAVACEFFPHLIYGFADNILKRVGASDSATRLVVECRTTAMAVGALAFVGTHALKKPYKAGILTMNDLDATHDMIIRSGISG